MKKIGSVLFCFIPFLITLAIQFAVMLGGVFLFSFQYILTDPEKALINPGAFSNDLLTDIISNSSFTVGVSAIYAILSATLFSIWYYKKFAKSNTYSVTNAFNPLIISAIVILCLSLQYLSSYIVSGLAFLRPDWLNQYDRIIDSLGLSQSVSILTVVYTSIIAPISEEILFRGVTLRYAKNAMPFWAANIFQAALFGLLHMNFIQGIYAFVIGIVFGYIALKGESLFIPIAFHMLFNMMGVFLPEVLHFTNAANFVIILIFLLSIVLLIAGILLFNQGIAKREVKNG